MIQSDFHHVHHDSLNKELLYLLRNFVPVLDLQQSFPHQAVGNDAVTN